MAYSHSLRCTPLERARIAERAKKRGMSVSAFLVACALHEETEDPAAVAEPEEPRLAMSEEEERRLYDRVADLDRLRGALYERLPGLDVSMFGAIAFLERALRSRGPGG